jgi:hypothetical protein
MASPDSSRAAKKAARKADKAHKRAVQKEYDRNHAQLKRQLALHGSLLAAQVRRGKKRARQAK